MEKSPGVESSKQMSAGLTKKDQTCPVCGKTLSHSSRKKEAISFGENK